MEDVKFVINLDYPSNSEDYVHRIGRTGRSQRTGTAYAFFTPGNAHKATDLIQVLEEAKQVVNPKLYELSRNPGIYKSTSLSSISLFDLIVSYVDLFILQGVVMEGAAEAVADAVPVGAVAAPEDLAAAATEETGVADLIAPAAVTGETNGMELTAVCRQIEIVTFIKS